jgi:hypothetical protein
VTPATDRVGEFAQRRQVRCFVQRDAVGKRETLSRESAFRDFVKSFVV